MPLKRTVHRFPATLVDVLVLVLAPILLIAMSTSATGATGPRLSEPHTGSTCNGTLASGTVVGLAASADDGGYWVANNEGEVVACGDALAFPGLTQAPIHPIVGIAATPDGGGYFLVGSDGGIFAFGDAAFHGSMGGMPLNKPIVGIAVDPATGGYWLVASDGGIFAFDAPFAGSTGSLTLNRPVVGMAPAPGGAGYWLVASDGGIFAFGAPFLGSMGGMPLNRPVVGMSADLGGTGYWLVASDGGIFSFGAPFLGSTGAIHLNQPIVGMESNISGTGYRFVASDGGVFNYGTSLFFGSAVAPPPSPTSPPVTSTPSCSASMLNSTPPDGGDVSVSIASNVANEPVSVSAHYKTTTSTFGGSTDVNGNATVVFDIGTPTVDYMVAVDVTVGAASCSTSFTPT
jgi:hypothetical protein